MTSIAIDKGVPLPRPAGHPFSQMKPGESCFFPFKIGNRSEVLRLRTKTRLSALNANASVVTRIVEENGIKGLRVWRIA
jgi:hypothetical protein